jgi:hypothetical protein
MWSGEANTMQSHKTISDKGDDANAHTTGDHTKPDRTKVTPMHTQQLHIPLQKTTMHILVDCRFHK